MNCRRSRRAISDGLDGALGPRRARAVESHLERCPDCRAYDGALRRLNAGAARSGRADIAPEAERDFLRRLEDRLDREIPRTAPAPASIRRRGWAWGAAGLAAAGAGLAAWLVLLRPVPRPEVYILSDADSWSGLGGQFTVSPDLEESLDEILLASIDDTVLGSGDGYETDPLDDPLRWAGASEDEIRQLEETIAAEGAR